MKGTRYRYLIRGRGGVWTGEGKRVGTQNMKKRRLKWKVRKGGRVHGILNNKRIIRRSNGIDFGLRKKPYDEGDLNGDQHRYIKEFGIRESQPPVKPR